MALQFRTAKRWITKRVTPDYTNQLDLFSEAAPEAPASGVNAPRRVSGVSPARPRPQQLHFLEWEPLPPEEAVRTSAAKPAHGNTGGGAVHQSPARPDTTAQDQPSPNTGTGDGRDRSPG